MGTPSDSEITKTEIVEAAGQLFSEFGFKGVTVRDITTKSGCNLSAVNYHFGTKKNLYRDVILQACETASITTQEQQVLLSLPPQESLYELIKGILLAYNHQKEPKWQFALISREVQSPSFLFSEIIDLYYKPQITFITQIVGRCLNKPLESNQNWFAAFSLISLVEMFGLYRHLLAAVSPNLLSTFEQEDVLVNNIMNLVLANK